ncbi:MAG: D-alanyl-D-alanine carboxypeptidase [Lachnospiraceae bacterium]|nr:D-alanyl-D-alanine carboxypeptidase [Lachnospiraceae bacterium]
MKKLFILMLASSILVGTCGCGQEKFDFKYDSEYDVSSFQIVNVPNESVAKAFASQLCVVSGDVMNDETVDMSQATSAVLFDVARNDVLYSKNAHEQLYPASLTKILTAYVALKYGSLDQELTATSVVNITEDGAQLCGLKVGDKMTLSQALHILLMYSANDVAMLIAEGVGGTVEDFMELMNQEAHALGATNSHFANPHGLTDANHYTTAYDLYLIFNEAIKNETIREIISMTSYSTVYHDKKGREKEISFQSTNRYFRGEYDSPDHVTILGGKTGTTNAAGHCLLLLSKDNSGDLYISIILQSAKRDILYSEMTDLLDEIGK